MVSKNRIAAQTADLNIFMVTSTATRIVRRGVATLDASHGRTLDEASERMCGSLFCPARDNGLSRVDHVPLSQANAQGDRGTHVFVVQGDPR